MDIFRAIDKLGELEDSLTEREFVSPVYRTRTVATRVGGVIYTFKVPRTAPGWYRFKARDPKNAVIVGEADYTDRERYLKYLGCLRLSAMVKKGELCRAVPTKGNKFGLNPTEALPVLLVDDTPMDFDRIVGRFDGAHVWFESVDMAHDPMKGEYLRESLREGKDPKDLASGLSFEEKVAYSMRYSLEEQSREDQRRQDEHRRREERRRSVVGSTQDDVEHAGGRFIDVLERQDHLQVTYEVDGHRYTSTVSKTPEHNIISAGICLEGMDADFDLKSLITVVREGQHRDLIYRF